MNNELYDVAMLVKQAASMNSKVTKAVQKVAPAAKSKLQAASALIKKNPRAAAAAITAALAVGAGTAYKKHEVQAAKTAALLMYKDAQEDAENVNTKLAFAQELYADTDYVEKCASYNIDGSKSKTAAEILYSDGLEEAQEVNEKLAFAEQLYAEALEAEKTAADNGPAEDIPYVDQVHTLAGAADVGAISGGAVQNIKADMANAAPGINASGIQAASALKAFVDQHRAARAAQQAQQTMAQGQRPE